MSSDSYLEDFEVLTIETPEGLDLRLPLAGFGPRAMALLLDSLFSGLAALLVILVLALIIGAAAWNSPDTAILLLILMIVLVVMIPVAYYVVFEYLWNGQTPGKRILNIRVLKRGGVPLTFMDVLVRNILRPIDSLFASFVGLVSFFATQYQQRLGDLAADTVVIKEFGDATPYTWALLMDAKQSQTTQAGVTLDATSMYLVSRLLSRRNEIDSAYRYTLSGEIINRLGYSADNLTLDQREGYLYSLLYPQQQNQYQ